MKHTARPETPAKQRARIRRAADHRAARLERLLQDHDAAQTALAVWCNAAGEGTYRGALLRAVRARNALRRELSLPEGPR